MELESKNNRGNGAIGAFIAVLILQLVFGILGFSGAFVNGFDTFIPKLYYQGLAFFALAVIAPFPFWYSFKKKGKQGIFSLNFVISGCIVAYFAFAAQVDLSNSIHQKKEEKRYLEETTLLYQGMVEDIDSQKITILDIADRTADRFPYVLKTNQDWNIYIKARTTPAGMEYLEREILGKEFKITKPDFSIFYSDWMGSRKAMCTCDVTIGGRSLQAILDQYYIESTR